MFLSPFWGWALAVICPCALSPLAAAAALGCVWDGESQPQSPERKTTMSSLEKNETHTSHYEARHP